MSNPDPTGEHHAHAEVADPKVLFITFLSLTFGVVFVVLILAIYHESYLTGLKSANQEGWTREADTTFSVRSGDVTHLSTYGVSEGKYHIPISAASELVLAEYARVPRPGAGVGMATSGGEGLGFVELEQTKISDSIENNSKQD